MNLVLLLVAASLRSSTVKNDADLGNLVLAGLVISIATNKGK